MLRAVIYDPAIFFCACFAASCVATRIGLAKIILPLTCIALGIAAVFIIGQTVSQTSGLWDTVSIFAGFCIGSVLGYILNWKANLRTNMFGFVRQRFAELTSDVRMRVLIVSLIAGMIATYIFAKLQASEMGHSFWHGFYEAWTASVAFFGILGISSLVVAFYHPEKESFATRVRILCAGRSGPEVDYITGVIRNVGYYAEDVEREIRIKEYDPKRRAYRVETKQRSIVQNFYDDEASDVLKIVLQPDPLEPARLDGTVGTLNSVRFGEELLCGPTTIRSEKFSKEWIVKIPKSEKRKIEIIHELWLRTDKPHNYRSHRFAKKQRLRFVFDDEAFAPTLRYTIFHHPTVIPPGGTMVTNAASEQQVDLEPGKWTILPDLIGCYPDVVFLTFHLDAPGVKTPG